MWKSRGVARTAPGRRPPPPAASDTLELLDGAETCFDLAERQRDHRHDGCWCWEVWARCRSPPGALVGLAALDAGADCWLDHGVLRGELVCLSAPFLLCRVRVRKDRPEVVAQRREYRTECGEGGTDRSWRTGGGTTLGDRQANHGERVLRGRVAQFASACTAVPGCPSAGSYRITVKRPGSSSSDSMRRCAWVTSGCAAWM
jgi:hypothetical protein